MGVKGLQYYLEQICGDDVCLHVSIRKMAEAHQRNISSGEKSIIAVDGMGLIRKIYGATLDWVYGGQWREFVQLLADFVQRFRDLHIKLVFFFDGPVCQEKRQEWVARRKNKESDIEKLFDKMKITGSQPENIGDFQPPAGTGVLIRFALKFCCDDIEVYSTVKEADIEIAEFARKDERVFAILGQDTDFVIFNTKPYLSLTHLNMGGMTSILYDRQRLLSKLQLTMSQLPLFSCLLGNDVIPVELVKPFHRKICHAAGHRGTSSFFLVPLISDMIKRNRWSGDFRNQQEIAEICCQVFGGHYNVSLIRNGIMFYSLFLKENDLEPSSSILYQRHVNCENFASVYGLHRNFEFDASEVLEDYADQTLPPANLAFRPIRQRAYSILFQEVKNINFHVKEWCSVSRRDLHEPDLVPARPINIHGPMPKLEDLWCSTSPEIQNIRLDCFYACLGGALRPSDMRNVQGKYQIFCCLVNYLLVFTHNRKPLLAPWEVAAFIAQAIHPRAGDPSWLNSLKVPCVDTHAVQLATLFMRGVTNLGTVLGICGYPIPLSDSMPWNFFNGKLFHIMYLKAKKGTKPDELCEYKAEVIEEFYNLLSVIKIGSCVS